ncbi:hypothetical protein BHE74_00015052 [Ensete ventricosum]|uniref:Uncharacterized protein n=1 Tax=Ensete ventricosum TaxID=4639 RepID=A0A445MI60_ENSVE|nr:hypothetical protein BHE74_00015052 [Ensete ventricosum]RZR73886.1 hypothetical protein BHM03_00029234 [Ensete ventricosum]
MTTKHKSLTSGSSIHPHPSEVSGVDKSIAVLNTIPFTISSKGQEYPTNTRVQKYMSNKSDIYRKHTRNNKIYMC